MSPGNGWKYWTDEQLVFHRALGLQIRAARLRAGLTQGELAEILGYERGSVAAIESGKQSPTVFRLAQLIQLLGLKDLPYAGTEAPVACCETEAMGIEGAGHSPGCRFEVRVPEQRNDQGGS